MKTDTKSQIAEIEYHVLSKQFDTENEAKRWAIRCCNNLAKSNGVSLLKWHKSGGWFVIIPLSKDDYTNKRLISARKKTVTTRCTLHEWLLESTKSGLAGISPLYVRHDAGKIINITYEVLI